MNSLSHLGSGSHPRSSSSIASPTRRLLPMEERLDYCITQRTKVSPSSRLFCHHFDQFLRIDEVNKEKLEKNEIRLFNNDINVSAVQYSLTTVGHIRWNVICHMKLTKKTSFLFPTAKHNVIPLSPFPTLFLQSDRAREHYESRERERESIHSLHRHSQLLAHLVQRHEPRLLLLTCTFYYLINYI